MILENLKQKNVIATLVIKPKRAKNWNLSTKSCLRDWKKRFWHWGAMHQPGIWRFLSGECVRPQCWSKTGHVTKTFRMECPFWSKTIVEDGFLHFAFLWKLLLWLELQLWLLCEIVSFLLFLLEASLLTLHLWSWRFCFFRSFSSFLHTTKLKLNLLDVTHLNRNFAKEKFHGTWSVSYM